MKTRRPTDSPVLDSTLIGGQALAEYVHGHVNDTDLPSTVVDAFKLQYPHLAETTTFSDHVRDLYGSPEQLAGFLAGVKGKVFELQAVDYLNSDQLPHGLHAGLAASSTQPGYDIVIEDSHHRVVEVLQAKATASLDLVHDHLHQYPHIASILTTSDLAGTHIADASLIPVPVSSADLTQHLRESSDAVMVHPDFHLPYFAGLAIAVSAVIMWKQGTDRRIVADHVATRTVGAVASTTILQLLAVWNAPVAIAGGVATRLLWSHIVGRVRGKMTRDRQFLQALRRANASTENAVESTKGLLKTTGEAIDKIRANRSRKGEL